MSEIRVRSSDAGYFVDESNTIQ